MDKKPVLIFDLDGTLAETAPDLLASLNYCLQKRGIKTIPSQELRHYIGHGGRVMIEQTLRKQGAEPDSAEADAMLADFMAYYTAHIPGESHYFPGALAALKRFAARGYVFAVCTNKAEALARRLIKALNAQNAAPCPFAALRGGDSFAWKKPDPRHIFSVIDEAGGDPKRAVMVGDSAPDILAAKAAGIPSIACRFGYSDVPVAELGADVIIDSYDELTVRLVEELLSKKA